MNIGEYRTDGKAVVYRRDASTCLAWAEGESVSTVWMTNGAEYFTWRTMPPDEVTLWRGGAPPLGWQERAETAEKALADVRVAVAVWRVEWHQEDCPAEDGGGCDPKMCGCDVQNDARTEARQLLGLEPKP